MTLIKMIYTDRTKVFRQSQPRIVLSATLIALLLLAGCSKSQPASEQPAAAPKTAEVEVVKSGKLANVFVYVKEGLPQGSFAVPAQPAPLDQKGCRYIPHLLGVVAGQ